MTPAERKQRRMRAKQKIRSLSPEQRRKLIHNWSRRHLK
ncbi:MAG: hypothetical protein ACC653_01180 [Gammaproteobacteria bacterium]